MSAEVMVVYPGFGTVWLSEVEWHPDHVEGSAWDESDCGSPYLPDDYRGGRVWLNFPLSSVVKVRPAATNQP